MKIGITGNTGFIGKHLQNAFAQACDIVTFKKEFFANPHEMRVFTDKCDAVIHLAAISRHKNGDFLYNTNINLTQQLADALTENTRVYLGSTTHIAKDLPYHKSKRESARILENSNAKSASAILMPNTFGEGSRPFYNSVVSTFCHLAAHGEKPPVIDRDAVLKLIHIDELCRKIVEAVTTERAEQQIVIEHSFEVKLGYLWDCLEKRKTPENEFESALIKTLTRFLE